MINTDNELELIAENDYDFYNQHTTSIVKQMNKLFNENAQNRGESNAWCYGALNFCSALDAKYSRDCHPKVRMRAATTMTNHYMEEIKLGNY